MKVFLFVLLFFLSLSAYGDWQIVSIESDENLVWVNGSICRKTGSRLCEGIIYKNVVIQRKDKQGELQKKTLNRLILLNEKSLNCSNEIAYWGVASLAALVSKEKTVLGHPFKSIKATSLKFTLLDYAQITNHRLGFWAEGKGYIGKFKIKISFDQKNPFMQDRFIENFCSYDSRGVEAIFEKTVEFGEGLNLKSLK